MVVSDDPDWCEQEVKDSLTIEPAKDAGVTIAVELVQANAHICTFEGTLAKAGDQVWEWRATDGEAACHLQLRWGLDTLKLSSEGCRDYCGARASLEATFSYPGDRVN